MPRPDTSGSTSGSWWPDIGARVREAVNAWLTELVTGAVGPAVTTAGALMDPTRLTATGMLYQLWAASRTVANTVFVLMVLAGGVIVLGFETVQSRYAIKQIAPRLVWGWLAANLSWPLLTMLTQLAAALAVAVAGSTVHPGDILTRLVTATVTDGPTFMVILVGVVAVLALALTLTLIVITAILLGLTVLAPLALCLHALPQTEAVAWCWWRAFAGALTVPTLHGLLLALLARVLLTPGGLALGVFSLPVGPVAPGSPLNLLVVIALLYLMIKIPGWVLRAATGTTARRGGGLRAVMSSLALTAGLSALGVPLPAAALAGRGGRAHGGPAGLAALGLRAATSRQPSRRPAARAATTSSAATSRRPASSATSPPAPSTRSPKPATGKGPAAQADPYARIRVNRDGQLLLPLSGVTRQPPTPAGAGPLPARRAPGPARAASTPPRQRPSRPSAGRQLRLPLGREWPEQRPVLGRDSQYRLPIRTPRTPSPVAGRDRARRATTRDPRRELQPSQVSRPGPGQLRLPLAWPRPPRRQPQPPAAERANPTTRANRERGTL